MARAPALQPVEGAGARVPVLRLTERERYLLRVVLELLGCGYVAFRRHLAPRT